MFILYVNEIIIIIPTVKVEMTRVENCLERVWNYSVFVFPPGKQLFLFSYL